MRGEEEEDVAEDELKGAEEAAEEGEEVEDKTCEK